MMQMKMPAKRYATSLIGSHSKPFAARSPGFVTRSEASPTKTMMSSRIRFCSSILVPSKSKPMPGRQKPLATMARIAMPMSPTFTWPLTPSFTAAVPAGGGVSSRPAKKESTKKKIASKTPDANKACGHRARVVQKKSIPPKEAKEQRRIAKRRQHSANVRDKKNKEDHHMGVEGARAIGANERLDQDHRGAGRSDPDAIRPWRSPDAASTSFRPDR